ncbi:MAG: sensor histidine kinase [Rickettsiaceae bacterium]|jgi:signal transduction histidine kinase|nr:sensor histidine kinase [Rickettsiaceae bacterium]
MQFLNKIHSNITRNALRDEKQFIQYGIITALGFVAFQFFNQKYITEVPAEKPLLRLFAVFLSLLLIFKNFWPKAAKAALPYVWYIALLYNLPLFFTYMFLENHGSVQWQLNGIMALAVLIVLTNFITTVTLTFLGTSLAILIYILQGKEFQVPADIEGFISSYLTVFIYCSLFSEKKEKIYQEKFDSMKAVAGAIAHEMRTPLNTISNMVQNFNNYLPLLFKTYNLSKDHLPLAEKLEKSELEFLENLPKALDKVNRSAFTFIDMLLIKLKSDIDNTKLDKLSIKDAVSQAIYKYPLTHEDMNLIQLNLKEDFSFKANELLFTHVIFNLLKNALYYVKSKPGKGKIIIWAEKGTNFNILYFKDTGPGISAKSLPIIFDRFYSNTEHGTGIGLAFCRLVINSVGGIIDCESVEGEYTLFTIKLPVINKI